MEKIVPYGYKGGASFTWRALNYLPIKTALSGWSCIIDSLRNNSHEIPSKIAVIGSGVAGLTAAYLLNKKHDVYLIEKEDRIGGHTRTLEVSQGENVSHFLSILDSLS